MLFEIIRQRPNPREGCQKDVEDLCRLLVDKKGQSYRNNVFGLLILTGNRYRKQVQKYSLKRLHDSIEGRQFRRCFPADAKALEILNELDAVYSGDDVDAIDDRRGAILEVFSYLMCRKIFMIADIEIKIKIEDWISTTSIDSAGCNKRKGCCFQGKATSEWWESIKEQVKDLNTIESLTGGRSICAFLTFQSIEAFHQHLIAKGLNKDDYRVFGRYQMADFEQACCTS